MQKQESREKFLFIHGSHIELKHFLASHRQSGVNQMTEHNVSCLLSAESAPPPRDQPLMPWAMVGIECATNNRNAPKSLDFGKPTKHFAFKNKVFIKELLTA